MILRCMITLVVDQLQLDDSRKDLTKLEGATIRRSCQTAKVRIGDAEERSLYHLAKTAGKTAQTRRERIES